MTDSFILHTGNSRHDDRLYHNGECLNWRYAKELLQTQQEQIEKLQRILKTQSRVLENTYDEMMDLKVTKFKRFNEDECWIYQGDGEDNLESLVCPVVICPKKLIELIGG